MKVWLSLPFFSLDRLSEIVVEAERVGLEGVTVSDHVCVPAEVETPYPYTGTAAVLPLDTPFPDPMTLAGFLAGRTQRLRIATHVLIAPLRHPLLLAKETATVAVMSGGRFDLGIGVGWMKEEFDAVDVPFEERGARTDEIIQVLRSAWTGDVFEYHGKFYDFAPLAMHPYPAESVPLFVGGYSGAALRRAATVADGWLGVTPRFEELEEFLGKLAAERDARGTADRAFTLRSGVRGTLTPELIGRVAKLGIDALIVSPQQLVPKGTDPHTAPTEVLVDSLEKFVAQAGEA